MRVRALRWTIGGRDREVAAADLATSVVAWLARWSAQVFLFVRPMMASSTPSPTAAPPTLRSVPISALFMICGAMTIAMTQSTARITPMTTWAPTPS